MATSGMKQEYFSGNQLGTEVEGYVQYTWWQVSQLESENCTNIEWNLTIKFTRIRGTFNRLPTVNKRSWSIKINEYDTLSGEHNLGTVEEGTTYTIATGNGTIYHNPNGTKTFTYYFSYQLDMAGVSPIYIYGNSTGELNPINYPAKITKVSDFNDTENPVIEYTNQAGDRVTALQVQLFDGKNMGYTEFKDVPISGGTYTINLSADEKNALLDAIPTKDNMKVSILLRTTFDGNFYDDIKEVIFSVIDAEPIVSATVKDINAATVALTGNDQKMIRYRSNAQYTIGAAARKGAELKTVSIKNGAQILRTTTTGTFNAVSSNTYYLTATDSRGKTTNNFAIRDLIPYVPLTCNKVTINDFNARGELTFTIDGKYFNGSFGEQNNSMQLQYMIKDSYGNLYEEEIVSGTPTGNMIPFNDTGERSGWVELGEINPTTDTEDRYTYTRTLSGLDYLRSYEITVNVNDALTPVQERSTVAAVVPIFDWSEEDFNFNIPVKAGKGIIVPNEQTDITDAPVGGGVFYERSDGEYADLISVINNTIFINRANAQDNTTSKVRILGNDVEVGADNFNVTGDNIELSAPNVTISASSGAFNIDDIYFNNSRLGDFVIEQGTDNLYSYRKWSSGKLEAWRSTQNTVSISTNKADGALYYSNDLSLTVSGTPAFTAVESVQLTLNKNKNAGLFYPILVSYGISNGVVTINYIVANSNIKNGAAMIPYVYVVGRWK